MPQLFMQNFAKQANDVLRAILDQSTDCIKLVNLAGEIEYLNPNGLRALGIDSLDRVAGRPWSSVWPEANRDRVELALDRARRGQLDRFDGYCPNFRGEPRWWDVSVSPITDSDGRISHILATSRDVTERTQTGLGDRMRREEAERNAARSDDIAREMRHRLKNQLAVVSAVTKLLARRSNGSGDFIDRLEIKLQSLARAQDLLTVHRDTPPSARTVTMQVLDASGAGDRISVAHLPDVRLGDDAIQQIALVLGELQTNSLKYGALRREGGRIVLSGSAADRVLIFVWDEDLGETVASPQASGAGFALITRMGSVPGGTATIDWHETGLRIEFHVRTQ